MGYFMRVAGLPRTALKGKLTLILIFVMIPVVCRFPAEWLAFSQFKKSIRIMTICAYHLSS